MRDAYIALDVQLQQWRARQAEGSMLVSTLCDFHARLRLTHEPRADGSRASARAKQFGALASDERFVDVLRHKHELGLHNLIAALRQTIGDLSAISDRLGSLATESWLQHGSRQVPLEESADAQWAPVPGALGVALRERIRLPSTAQLLEDHLALCSSCGEELRLKQQILARLWAGTGAAELQELAHLWSLEPCLDAERVAFVRAVAQCFAA